MKIYDYSFLENGMLPAGLVNLVSNIVKLQTKEKELKENYPDVFTKLQSIAKVQSVKGSNEIEGIITSEERINEIVNQNSAPLNHTEAEIAGYRDALSLIHDQYDRLDFVENDILRLHEIMFQYIDEGGGIYKTRDNIIREIRADGTRYVRFMPVPASETKHAMEQLVLAYIDARDNYGINKLLLIPCVILDFLCIHPFSDGNGRMSRLLSLMLLYQNGFDSGRYISFEEQINKTKYEYYQSLKDSSDNWHENKNSYFPFILHFVMTLLFCYKELDKRFAVVQSKKVTKQTRVRATVLNSLLPISKNEIKYILPDISMKTIDIVITEMIKEQQIEKIGGSKHTKYIKKKF